MSTHAPEKPRHLELADLLKVLQLLPKTWRNSFWLCAMAGLRMGEAKTKGETT